MIKKEKVLKRICLLCIFAAVLAIVLFFLYDIYEQKKSGKYLAVCGADSAKEAVDTYFRAFKECDGTLYASIMSDERRKTERRMYDNESEFDTAYADRFEEEEVYLRATYGRDRRISHSIKELTENKNSAVAEVCVVIKGTDRQNEDDHLYEEILNGTVTLTLNENGWKVYDVDFEKIFW